MCVVVLVKLLHLLIVAGVLSSKTSLAATPSATTTKAATTKAATTKAATTKPAAKAVPKKAPKKTAVPPPPSLGLLSLDGLASAVDKSSVEVELRSLLSSTGYAVQDKEELDETLVSVKKLGLVCDSGDVDCLIRVGALSGTTIVLKGLLSTGDSDGFALDLVAVDVNLLRERGRVRVTVPVAAPGRRAALDGALTGVLKPEVWRGQLRLGVAQRGASVVVDGVPRGFTPLSAPLELTPGPHAVFVVLEGFRTHKETVDVLYQSEVTVDVTLVPGVSEDAPLFSTAPRVLEPPKETTTAPARKHPLRVIVYDVEATGVPPRAATVLGTLLVAELRKREGISVLDSSELRAVVGGDTTAGDVRGCTEEQCFAEVAEALGADVVVVAQLTQLEGQVLFGLRRIDQQAQEVTGSFLERVPADDTAALLPLVGKSIAATFGDVPVRAGQSIGVDERASRIMNPPPLPPILSGSLYVGAGVAAAVAIAGGAVAGWNAYTYDELYKDIGTTNDADENRRLQDAAQWFGLGQTAALIAGGATIVLGTAAVITGWSTDWQGDADAVAVDTSRTGAPR